MSSHTPGPWAAGCLADPTTECDCPSIFSEGYAGAVASICVDNRLLIAEGGNDCPPLAEAIANMKLIAAAPDLLASQTMGQSVNTPDFLDWLADRLVRVYGEPEGIDFVLSLRERAKAGRTAVAKALGKPTA